MPKAPPPPPIIQPEPVVYLSPPLSEDDVEYDDNRPTKQYRGEKLRVVNKRYAARTTIDEDGVL